MYSIVKESEKSDSKAKVSITKQFLREAKVALRMAGTMNLGTVLDGKMISLNKDIIKYLDDLLYRKKVNKYSVRVAQ